MNLYLEKYLINFLEKSDIDFNNFEQLRELVNKAEKLTTKERINIKTENRELIKYYCRSKKITYPEFIKLLYVGAKNGA